MLGGSWGPLGHCARVGRGQPCDDGSDRLGTDQPAAGHPNQEVAVAMERGSASTVAGVGAGEYR